MFQGLLEIGIFAVDIGACQVCHDGLACSLLLGWHASRDHVYQAHRVTRVTRHADRAELVSGKKPAKPQSGGKRKQVQAPPVLEESDGGSVAAAWGQKDRRRIIGGDQPRLWPTMHPVDRVRYMARSLCFSIPSSPDLNTL